MFTRRRPNVVLTDFSWCTQVYYLIFCRSVWHYPMRLDNALYIEIVFNQIAPDYLEGLLLVMPGEQILQECVVSSLLFVSRFDKFSFSWFILSNMTYYNILLEYYYLIFHKSPRNMW